MAEYEKKVRHILREYGCYFVRRGKGDHDIRNITVDGEIRIRYVANGIMKQAGIDYRF